LGAILEKETPIYGKVYKECKELERNKKIILNEQK